MSVYEEENRPIIYLDESGFKLHDCRPYGYSKKGQKCFGTYNWQLKNLTNTIGALLNGELFVVELFESSINSDIFYTWVDQVLIPELPDNSVIVMDNATFHKRSDIQGLIEENGHTILWLPPYSPDLNPIEPREHSSCLALGQSSALLVPRSGLGLNKNAKSGDLIVLTLSSSIFFGCVPFIKFYDYTIVKTLKKRYIFDDKYSVKIRICSLYTVAEINFFDYR